MRITFLLLILTTRVVFGQTGDNVRGSICGSVLDEKGLPASRVRVVAIDKNHQSGGFPSAFTDASGSYCIKGLRLGEWVLSAWDETKGYPHRGPLVYSWQTPDPKVELSLLNPDARSDWQIPFKAGFVKIQVPEMSSGSQSERVSIEFQVRSRPQAGFIGGTGQFPAGRPLTFLLPPDEDVPLTVTCADGHKWRDDAGEGKLLQVSSGATETITLPTSCFSKEMK
jgi:hypothetical protein